MWQQQHQQQKRQQTNSAIGQDSSPEPPEHTLTDCKNMLHIDLSNYIFYWWTRSRSIDKIIIYYDWTRSSPKHIENVSNLLINRHLKHDLKCVETNYFWNKLFFVKLSLPLIIPYKHGQQRVPASGSIPDATYEVRSLAHTFMWCTAKDEFQMDGGFDELESSICEDLCNIPCNFLEGDDRNVACDHYNRYASDVRQLLVSLWAKYQRHSLSWLHMLAHGDRSCDEVRIAKAWNFYNGLIDTLLSHRIKPVITLYH